jgi:hypothetical protein
MSRSSSLSLRSESSRPPLHRPRYRRSVSHQQTPATNASTVIQIRHTKVEGRPPSKEYQFGQEEEEEPGPRIAQENKR